MIEQVTHNNLTDVLPLIKAYQQFYHNDTVSEPHNREFFARFCDDDAQGCQFLYRSQRNAVAFATVYFTFSSQLANTVTLLNDLYVLPEYRGRGIATEMIQHCYRVSQARGTARLQWFTAEGNKTAQKLYNRVARASGHWLLFTKT